LFSLSALNWSARFT